MKIFSCFKVPRYYLRGKAYIRKGQHDQAIAIFSEIIKLTTSPKNSALAYQSRGDAYLLKGQNYQAVEDFSRAIELDPSLLIEAHKRMLTPEAKLERNGIFREIKEIEESGRASGRAFLNQSEGGKSAEVDSKEGENKISQEENCVQAIKENGINFFKAGFFDKAIDCFIKSLEFDPNNAGIHFFLGLAYGNKGNQDKAINEFTTAIEINPNHFNAYYNRGNEYFKKRNFDKAIADYTMAIKLNPKDAGAYYNCGIALREKGFFPLAWTYIRKAESLGYKVNT